MAAWLICRSGYLSGTVVLQSNVTLYLEAGATLLGSKDLADYALQPGPHRLGDANQKHLVFARDAENVGLAGPGRIDGQGAAFWVPSGRVTPPPDQAWHDVAHLRLETPGPPLARNDPLNIFGSQGQQTSLYRRCPVLQKNPSQSEHSLLCA